MTDQLVMRRCKMSTSLTSTLEATKRASRGNVSRKSASSAPVRRSASGTSRQSARSGGGDGGGGGETLERHPAAVRRTVSSAGTGASVRDSVKTWDGQRRGSCGSAEEQKQPGSARSTRSGKADAAAADGEARRSRHRSADGGHGSRGRSASATDRDGGGAARSSDGGVGRRRGADEKRERSAASGGSSRSGGSGGSGGGGGDRRSRSQAPAAEQPPPPAADEDGAEDGEGGEIQPASTPRLAGRVRKLVATIGLGPDALRRQSAGPPAGGDAAQ